MIQKSEAITKLNQLGTDGIPFEFYCDFLGEKWCIEPLNQVPRTFKFQTGIEPTSTEVDKIHFSKSPISFTEYQYAIEHVIKEINLGNSFLTNLTFETPIHFNIDLDDIFMLTSAKYRLLVPDHFVVFSPETFVQIHDQTIKSFPMKGTIDANVEDAAALILNDEKEKAEHVTIVDLIRNDLSQVAQNITVDRFRYIEEIHTRGKNLLQVSSEVTGQLNENWNHQLGDLLTKLLPAGSISGAPKPETLKIIQRTERYKRDFYTGICGRFDGKSLDSGVMIRFIKKEKDQYVYCSGGGITSFSDAEKEYDEMIDKVYLPI